jgi:K+-transporting ATPase KdpF subunit
MLTDFLLSSIRSPSETGGPAMNGLYWLGLIVTVALFVYLFIALVRPEKF